MPAVLGTRPVAYITRSVSNMPPSGVCSWYGALPSGRRMMRSISVSVRILMPLAFSDSCTKVRHSSSKPRSTRSRRITMSTWQPSPWKMPANSTAM